ncbi:MAG TPA: hypothetical protein VJT72_21780 [Pseudonocardiaceae bacterium]|nr:hypothetical protein [Pseudonocardiaceae bacterium]
MFFPQPGDVDESTGEHQCLVAGQQADGKLTDVWSGVDNRYLAYIPRCECGWTGPPFSCTPGGYAACERLWRDKHLQSFLRARESHYRLASPTWSPRVIQGGG